MPASRDECQCGADFGSYRRHNLSIYDDYIHTYPSRTGDLLEPINVLVDYIGGGGDFVKGRRLTIYKIGYNDHYRSVTYEAYDHDKDYRQVYNTCGTWRMINIETGEEIGRLDAPSYLLKFLSFTPDGQMHDQIEVISADLTVLGYSFRWNSSFGSRSKPFVWSYIERYVTISNRDLIRPLNWTDKAADFRDSCEEVKNSDRQEAFAQLLDALINVVSNDKVLRSLRKARRLIV